MPCTTLNHRLHGSPLRTTTAPMSVCCFVFTHDAKLSGHFASSRAGNRFARVKKSAFRFGANLFEHFVGLTIRVFQRSARIDDVIGNGRFFRNRHLRGNPSASIRFV